MQKGTPIFDKQVTSRLLLNKGAYNRKRGFRGDPNLKMESGQDLGEPWEKGPEKQKKGDAGEKVPKARGSRSNVKIPKETGKKTRRKKTPTCTKGEQNKKNMGVLEKKPSFDWPDIGKARS